MLKGIWKNCENISQKVQIFASTIPNFANVWRINQKIFQMFDHFGMFEHSNICRKLPQGSIIYLFVTDYSIIVFHSWLQK